MAKSHSIILPFPAEIDRDDFGHWPSGFTDGEGHFGLYRKGNGNRTAPLWSPQAKFGIDLRADDIAILLQIQSFFGCGVINPHIERLNPQSRFYISTWTQLAGIVVPHFDRYPLRAKKAKDFAIWREAVLYGADVSRRMWLYRHGGGGRCRKWEPAERDRYLALYNLLRQQRAFVP